MIISFFSPTKYTTGVDYSAHSDLIYQEDIDFDPQTQTATLSGSEGSYTIIVEDKPTAEKVETEEEKHKRVFKKLIATNLNKDTDKSILEGIEFKYREIGDIIMTKNFPDIDGEFNPYDKEAFEKRIDNGIYTDEDVMRYQQVYEVGNNVLDFFGMQPLPYKPLPPKITSLPS